MLSVLYVPKKERTAHDLLMSLDEYDKTKRLNTVL